MPHESPLVCSAQGTLFTPLDKTNTSTQSLNVQLRKRLDLHVNLVHGFSIPGLNTRHEGLDIVVVRCVPDCPPHRGWRWHHMLWSACLYVV